MSRRGGETRREKNDQPNVEPIPPELLRRHLPLRSELKVNRQANSSDDQEADPEAEVKPAPIAPLQHENCPGDHEQEPNSHECTEEWWHNFPFLPSEESGRKLLQNTSFVNEKTALRRFSLFYSFCLAFGFILIEEHLADADTQRCYFHQFIIANIFKCVL